MAMELRSRSPRPEFVDEHGAQDTATWLAELRDDQVSRLSAWEIVDILSRLRPPFLERRVYRRLRNFDPETLQRLLFLCRRSCRNQLRLRPGMRPAGQSPRPGFSY